jgi:P-type Cu+ transporter
MAKPQLLELEIEGMTCTACARRVEKNLNKVEGVTAYVDFATEKAHIQLSKPLEQEFLTKAVENAGYKVSKGKSESQTLKPRLFIGGFLSIAAMLLGMTPWFRFEGSQFVLWAVVTPVFFYVAFPFHSAAIKNLRRLDTTMDTLVSLGSSVAYGYSVYLVLQGEMHSYFEVAAVVPTIVLVGRFIEVRARRSATDAVRALLSAIPESATIERAGERKTIPSSEIMSGDIVFVAAGEKIPADGKLLTAHASIDNSTLTGESLPTNSIEGDLLSAGATSLSGQIAIEAVGSAATSRLARIADLVREATAQKTKIASLTDRISSVFVPSVIALAITTYLVWTFVIGDQVAGFEAAVAVLVIACPCALGIAVPMSLVVATSIGTKRSVVIRNPDALGSLAKIKRVVFDKTGTLTDGQLRVVNSKGLGDVGAATMLSYAAAVERGSKHPVALAISKISDLKTAENVREIPGIGLTGQVDEFMVSVERPGKYANQEELDEALKLVGPNTLVVVAWEGWAHGLIELSDKLKPNAKATISALTQMGITSSVLSGDNPARVAEIAKLLGAAEHLGGISPEGKLAKLKSLENTAMVGDGINDVAALSAATVGIAMGSGSHAAQAASAIMILDDDPMAIPFALRLAKKTNTNIKQNLGWAFGYNLILIPVAALGFLNPMLAGIAMAFSSVSVVANSLRLRWQNR